MEADFKREKMGKIKKGQNDWFLDIRGKLTRMPMLKYARDVHLEDNIIFADDRVFQIIVESDGHIALSEIKDISQKEPSEHEHQDFIWKPMQEDGDKRFDDTESKDEVKLNDRHFYKDNLSNTITPTDGSVETSSVKDNNTSNNNAEWSDQEQNENCEYSSEEYKSRKGIKSLLQRFKKRLSLASAPRQKREDITIYQRVSLPTKTDNEVCDNENPFCVKLDEPITDVNAYLSDVPGSKTYTCTALYDFTPFTGGYISFYKGDKLRIRRENLGENCDFYLAEHCETGKEGYIPMAYVTDDFHELQAKEWWFDISSRGAEELLSQYGCPVGTYLIRPSESESGFVLSLLAPNHIRHYSIKSQNGRLYIYQDETFRTFEELIEFYKNAAWKLRCKLVSPAPKSNPSVYQWKIEIAEESISFTESLVCGSHGILFHGKLLNKLDVTLITEFKQTEAEFMTEAKFLNEFRKSSHFVRVIAVVVNPKPFIMVLGETIRCTLQQHLMLDKGKIVKFKSLTDIAAQIAAGMHVLALDDIVHGQLKAENIFVCYMDKVKIVHPRLCTMMKNRCCDEHVECDNDWKWIAPEATGVKKTFTSKSDVWSYGVLLYELITLGNEPYHGLVEEDTLRCLKRGYRLPKPNGPLRCPDPFYAMILKCWYAQPACRPTFYYLADFFHDFELPALDRFMIKVDAYDGLSCKLEIPCQKTQPQEQFRGMEISRESVKLGKGKFGKLYAGKWRKTVDVAVKTLEQDQKLTDDFLTEAKVMLYLQHNKLVQLMAVCTKTEPIWIITELMINGALLDYLRKDEGKSLSFNLLADMARQIADGMAYLTTRNCVHRDLRAANILVGKHNEVKVAGFSQAKFVHGDVYEAHESHVFLTKWTAPEAVFYRKFSIKSDVWSYGILLYELITLGGVPYPDLNDQEVRNLVKRGFGMDKPRREPVPYPNAYYEIMLKCWDRYSDHRPTFAFLRGFFSNILD